MSALEQFFTSWLGQIVITAVILLFLYIISLSAPEKNKSEKGRLYTLTVSALLISAAFVIGRFPVLKMPQGGSVTLCSMLFLYLTGYFFGARAGIFAGAVYGMLDLLISPSVYYPMQVILDYPLAYAFVGAGALFRNNKHGLYLGYAAGVAGRFLSSFLSGFIFFGEYAPEGYSAAGWSLWYNFTYLGTEAALTLVVMFIPVVHRMLSRTKKEIGI